MDRITYLNRYRVVADAKGGPVELSRSGAAVTYQAADIHSGVAVALHVIPTINLRATEREKLERDALAAQHLEHANLPALLAFGTQADHLVYASTHCDGTPLEAWVKAHGSMPVGPALRIALQIVSALGAAATQGIVHRAVNPYNVVLVPGQTPEGDWPLVKILNLVGVLPTFMGAQARGEAEFAMRFASPEQRRQGTVDFQSEVYSLGATLWYCLTGAAPATDVRLTPAPGLPKPVLQLVEHMLASDPGQRPHDPFTLRNHIRLCLEQVERREVIGPKSGIPITAPAFAHGSRPRSAIPWPLSLAAVFLLLATLVTFFAAKDIRPDQLLAEFMQGPSSGPLDGAPAPAASTISAAPRTRAINPNAAPAWPAAEVGAITYEPVLPEPEASSGLEEAESAPPAQVVVQDVENSVPGGAVSSGEDSQQPLVATDEPPTPAEGPMEMTATAAPAAHKVGMVDRELKVHGGEPTVSLVEGSNEPANVNQELREPNSPPATAAAEVPAPPAEGPAETMAPPTAVGSETSTPEIEDEERPVAIAPVQEMVPAADPAEAAVAIAPRAKSRKRAKRKEEEIRIAQPVVEPVAALPTPTPKSRWRFPRLRLRPTPASEPFLESPPAASPVVPPHR